MAGSERVKKLPGSMMPAIKGSLTCVPTDVTTSVNILPRCGTSSDTVKAELKKKLENKSIQLSENIRPNKIENAFNILTKTPLYEKLEISQIVEKSEDLEKKVSDEIDLPTTSKQSSSLLPYFNIYGGGMQVEDEFVNIDSETAQIIYLNSSKQLKSNEKSPVLSTIRHAMKDIQDELKRLQDKDTLDAEKISVLEMDLVKI